MKWQLQKLTLVITLPLALSHGSNGKSALLQVIFPGYRILQHQLVGQSSFTLPSRGAPRGRMETATRLRFNLPPKGAPGDRGNAATRDFCAVVGKPPLTALVPGTNIGLTISERPTFWFYVPYQANPRELVEFSLTNDQEKTIYKATFQLTATPGIVSISLPPTIPPLDIGKNYHWVFSYTCNEGKQPSVIAVDGEVERIPLQFSLKQKLDGATPRERILLYAENGLWYDTLTNLIELRRQHPQDAQLTKDWENLLRQSPDIALDKLIAESVVSCCTAR